MWRGRRPWAMRSSSSSEVACRTASSTLRVEVRGSSACGRPSTRWSASDWIGAERPKMFSVQAEGCAPMVRAWQSGATEAEMWQDATTYASGLRVPAAVGDFLILGAVRESGGAAVAIPDCDMAEWVGFLGTGYGYFRRPRGRGGGRCGSGAPGDGSPGP